MKNNDLPRDAVRFPSVNDSIDRHGNGYRRRDFLKIIGTAAGAAGLVSVGVSVAPEKAQAFAYEPYYTDDQLTTVVTSCAGLGGAARRSTARIRATSTIGSKGLVT